MKLTHERMSKTTGSHMLKLIFTWSLINTALSFPSPQNIILPNLDVSPPEAINSLTQNHVYGRSINFNSKNQKNDIEETIKEVEAILKTNPALPRLTRGEILDLLENITQNDLNKSKVLDNRDPKSIMVVMPYTPSNENNMQDLYTKPPITQFIGGEPFTKPVVTEINKKPYVKQNNLIRKVTTAKPNTVNIVTTEKSRRLIPKKEIPEKHNFEKKENYHRSTTVTSTTFSSSTTNSPPRTRGTPMRRRRPTQPTKHPNHKYPEDESKKQFVPSIGMTIVSPPKLTTSVEVDQPTDLTVQENTKKETVLKSYTNFKTINKIPKKTVTTTITPLIEDLHLPQHLNLMIKDMNLESAINGKQEISTQKSTSQLPDINESDKIKEMLESLGILMPTTTSMPDVQNVADTLNPEMKDLLINFGLLPNPNQTKDAENIRYDSPNPEKADVNPESYIGFKPLPDDNNSRHEMEELLASFGLGRSSRKEKSLKKNEKNKLSFDFVPEQYKPMLTDDFGLNEGRKIESLNSEEKSKEKQHIFNPSDSQYATEEELGRLGKLIDMIKDLEKLNRTVTEEDLKKIDINNLKEFIGSLNPPDLKLVPLNENNNAPNPLDFDSGLSKNEVKRQEETTSTSTTTTPATSTTTTTTESSASSTEESRNPSFQQLEDSFGGQSSTVTTIAPVETTPSKRTGFYYLVDWNTFLDIDDQKGKRVNLRFQPTIGDPKRFLSVSVP